MLYDRRWDKKHGKTDTPNPFALDTLIGWLEKKDPQETYDYKHCRSCLLAQYFAAQGFEGPELSRTWVTYGTRLPGLGILLKGGAEQLPPFFDWIARDGNETFGSALERAKLVRDEPLEASRQALRSMW